MSAILQAIGGTAPYTWAISSGSLPAGLSLNTSTGAITGTPTTAGTSSFTVRVTDSLSATATKTLSITINPSNVSLAAGTATAPSGGSTVLTVPISNDVAAGSVILVGALSGNAGVTIASVTDDAGNNYSQVLSNTSQATAQLFVWEADSGNPLFARNPSTGTNDNVYVTYSSNGTNQGAIVVSDNGVAGPADKLVIAAGSSTAPSSGSSGTLTQSREHATAFIVDAAAGGVPTWGAGYSGNVLANIQTNGTTRLSAAQQNVNSTAALTASGTITSAPWAAAEVTTMVQPLSVILNMADGVQGEAYSQTLEIIPGTGGAPFTWSISSGSLPTGLSLNTSTGVISGTPTVNGTFNFTTRVVDTNGAVGTLAQSIIIIPNVVSGVPAIALPNDLLSVADATAESDSITWAADINAGTPATTTQIALAGLKSISWAASADGQTQIATGFYNVTPSTAYIASGYMLPAGARDCSIGVSWFDNTNTFIRTDYGKTNPSPTIAWQSVTGQFTSPPNAAKVKVVYNIAVANAGEVTHIDLTYFAAAEVQVLIDFVNPIFSADDSSGKDFMDVSPWVKMDVGVSLTRGRQDNISDIQPGNVSFSLQNDTGIFTRNKSTSLIKAIGGSMTLQRRFQVNMADELGVWHTRADGPISQGGYTFDNTGNTSVLQVSAGDVLAFLNRQHSLSCWTHEQVLSDGPLYHWTLNDPGAAKGTAIATESSGNGGLPLRQWNSDNTAAAKINFADTSGGVETLADTVAAGQPDGGEFWSPNSNQPTSALRGLDAGVAGPFTSPIGSINLVPTLTAQTAFNYYIGNIGYQLQGKLASVINPATTDYSFEIWFTADPGIKTNLASKLGPYTILSLGNSANGTTLVAGIFPTGSSPHNFTIATYNQPPSFQGGNFPTAGPPAQTQSITQTLPVDNVPLPHHLVITITGDPTSPTLSAWLDGVQFANTFSLPKSQKYDTISLGGAFGGKGCHYGNLSMASIYNYLLSAGTIIQHASMGQYGMWEQTTDNCISTIALLANIPSFWNNLTGNSGGLTLTEYQDISGNNAIAAMQIFEKAEDGFIFVDAGGNLTFHTRDWRMGYGAPDLYLPPDTFTSDLGYTLTDQFMQNEMGVSTQIFPTGGGFVNTLSQQNYGVYAQNSLSSPLQLPLITWNRAFGSLGIQSYYYFSDPNLDDRAAWEANTHSEPWLLPGQVVIDLQTLNKTSTGIGISDIYNLEIDNMIAPSGTLPASFPDGTPSLEWFIEGINEFVSQSAHTIQFYCSPAETQRAWIPGDATYGVLGTTARIGVSAADTGPEQADGKNVSHDAGRPYWAPNFTTGMNNPGGTNKGFIGALDIRGLTDNLQLGLTPPMLVVGQVGNQQTMPSGSNSTPQVFWDTVFTDTVGGMGLMPGWPNWYVVLVPGFYDIDACVVHPLGGGSLHTDSGWIIVAQQAAQQLAASNGTITPVTVGKYVCPIGEQQRINGTSLTVPNNPTTRMYLGLGDMVTAGYEQSSGANETSGSHNGGSRMSLLWRGYGQQDDRIQINSSVANGGTVTTPPGTTIRTGVYNNTHTYSYEGFNKSNGDRRNSDGTCFQGLYPGDPNNHGTQVFQIAFDYASIKSDLTVPGTVKILAVSLTGSNNKTWYDFTRVQIGHSTQTPGGSNFDARTVAASDVVEYWWPNGATKTYALTNDFATTFMGASPTKFILFGDGRNTEVNHYGEWQGGKNSWQLTIKYSVTV